MSLDAEGAQPPPGRRPGRSPSAATVPPPSPAAGPAGWSSSLIGTQVARPRQPGEQGESGCDGVNGDGEAALGNSAANYERPAFLSWAISTGTARLAQVNFRPLPPSVVTLSQARIAEIKG